MIAVHAAPPPTASARRPAAPLTVVSLVTATAGVNADAFLPYTYDWASAGLDFASAQTTETDSTKA